jgi:hypothetical protein
MKKNKIIFWATTVLVAGMMLFSGFLYLSSEELKAAFTHLGFPDYFRIELGLAKIAGALLLLIPAVPSILRLFTYFGFGLTFVSAIIAHLASGDPVNVAIGPFVFLALLVTSFAYRGKLEEEKQKPAYA